MSWFSLLKTSDAPTLEEVLESSPHQAEITPLTIRPISPLPCCCSVAQARPTLCDPVDCSTPDFPDFCHLPEFAQTHVHWVGDDIQPSCPLSSLFSSCLQSFPASGSFLMSWLFASHGQSIGASASGSVLAMSIQGWFPLWWTGWISLQSKGLSRVFTSTNSSKAWIPWHSAFFMVQLSHPYVTTGKTTALTVLTFVGKIMSLLFNMLAIWS